MNFDMTTSGIPFLWALLVYLYGVQRRPNHNETMLRDNR